jgi:DNA-binding response OmpR family regulator
MVDRILLVEDDPRLAEMLMEYLGQAGFGVTVAALGATALERLKEVQFDAVILRRHGGDAHCVSLDDGRGCFVITLAG